MKISTSGRVGPEADLVTNSPLFPGAAMLRPPGWF